MSPENTEISTPIGDKLIPKVIEIPVGFLSEIPLLVSSQLHALTTDSRALLTLTPESNSAPTAV